MMEPRRGRVVHAIPGRVRIKLNREELTEEFSRELRSALMAMSGVEDLQISPRTGSVVIYSDPTQLDVAGLRNLARAANLLALDAFDDDPYASKRPPRSLTARRIRRTFHEVDVRLAEMSAGRWDLRSVFPAALGMLALRQLIRDFGALGAAPWYVLAWYAFDSFWKLNHERDDAGDRPEASPIPPTAE